MGFNSVFKGLNRHVSRIFYHLLRMRVKVLVKLSTVQLHLSGIIWTDIQRNMHKIRITGFFFENRLPWQFRLEKKHLQLAILGYLFIYVQIKAVSVV